MGTGGSKVMSWIAIVDGLDKDDLVRNGFPYSAIVACAAAFIADRQDKGYETFDFCMGVWIGWQSTGKDIKQAAWNEAVNSVQPVV
jgi:hypothetical protein